MVSPLSSSAFLLVLLPIFIPILITSLFSPIPVPTTTNMPTSSARRGVIFTRTDDGIPQINYQSTNRDPPHDDLGHLHTRIDKVEDPVRKINETVKKGLLSSPANTTEALRSVTAISKGVKKLGNWATVRMPMKGSWWAGLAVGLTADKVWDLLYSTLANFVASQASAAMPAAAATVVVSNLSTQYLTITATTTAATMTVTSCFVQVVRQTR